MEYYDIYKEFKDKGYEMQFNSIDCDGSELIKYDSDYIFINDIQFHINYECITLSRHDLKINTRIAELGDMINVELRIKLDDIDNIGIGTRWWDD